MSQPVLFPQRAVRAERTNCRTDRTAEVEVVLEIRQGFDGKPWVHIAKDGVTGYESIAVEDAIVDLDALKADVPWAACWGTRGAWDRLEVFGRDLAAYLEDWIASAAAS